MSVKQLFNLAAGLMALSFSASLTPLIQTAEASKEKAVESADGMMLRFVRPAPDQVGPTWVEGYEQLIEASHPDGVEWVSYTITNQKKEQGKIGKRDPETGYFHVPRRYKSASTREYTLMMKTKKGEFVAAKTKVKQRYETAVRDDVRFVNWKDGQSVAADKQLLVLVNCTSSVGAGHQDQAIKDSDGIAWVSLDVDGVEQPRNESARSFGLYAFRIKLAKGGHALGIVAENTRGQAMKGPVIKVVAE